MANEQNLRPFTSDQDREKAAINGRKGGIASGEAKRRAKSFKETAKMLLALAPTNDVKKELEKLGIETSEQNMQTAIVTEQLKKALDGNIDSAKFMRDTSGEFIGAEIEEENEAKYNVCIPAKDIPPAFCGIYRDILNRKYTEYWLEGGRGSIKSTFGNEVVIDLLENNHTMCAVIIRRYSNTLKDSVYSQTQWTISQFEETYKDLSKDYHFKTSPLEVTKKSTGQKIYFRGTDDPGKLKSIKPPKRHVYRNNSL